MNYFSYCYHCKELFENSFFSPQLLCSVCFETLPWWNDSHCFFCGKLHATCCTHSRKIEFKKLRAIFQYKDPVRKWLISFKYHQNLIAGRILKDCFLYWLKKNTFQKTKFDVTLPIPSHYLNFIKKSWSHTFYLLPKKILPPISTMGLKKKYFTKHQGSLNRKERIKNIQSDMFYLNSSFSKKNILLFDDVYTTGQTLESVYQACKKLEMKSIEGIVLCRHL